jgi:hypothetical protein
MSKIAPRISVLIRRTIHSFLHYTQHTRTTVIAFRSPASSKAVRQCRRTPQLRSPRSNGTQSRLVLWVCETKWDFGKVIISKNNIQIARCRIERKPKALMISSLQHDFQVCSFSLKDKSSKQFSCNSIPAPMNNKEQSNLRQARNHCLV